MNTNNVPWSDEIGCEGGPVLVANLADFRQWRGSDPLDAAAATELHYWSPFTGELPQPWQPNGPTGHQYLAGANPAEAREKLMAVLLDLWPGTTIDRSGGVWRATRQDGSILNAALSPDSEYDRAIRDLYAESVHGFGGTASAYLWSAAPGMVRIDIDERRDFLLLSQVDFAEDDIDAQKAYDYARKHHSADAEPGLTYRITSGPVVVAWAPNSVDDLSKRIDEAGAAATLPGELLNMSTDSSGALIWLRPGLYQSTLQYHEYGSWGVSWCRLQRIGE